MIGAGIYPNDIAIINRAKTPVNGSVIVALSNGQRRITLSNFMSITPSLPAETARVRFKTWVKSQWKLCAFPGQISVEINRVTYLSFRACGKLTHKDVCAK